MLSQVLVSWLGNGSRGFSGVISSTYHMNSSPKLLPSESFDKRKTWLRSTDLKSEGKDQDYG